MRGGGLVGGEQAMYRKQQGSNAVVAGPSVGLPEFRRPATRGVYPPKMPKAKSRNYVPDATGQVELTVPDDLSSLLNHRITGSFRDNFHSRQEFVDAFQRTWKDRYYCFIQRRGKAGGSWLDGVGKHRGSDSRVARWTRQRRMT